MGNHTPYYHFLTNPDAYNHNKPDHFALDRIFKAVYHSGLLSEDLPDNWSDIIEQKFESIGWRERGKYTRKYRDEIGPFFSRQNPNSGKPTTLAFGGTRECPYPVALHMASYKGETRLFLNPCPLFFTNRDGLENPTSIWQPFIHNELSDDDMKYLNQLYICNLISAPLQNFSPADWVRRIRNIFQRVLQVQKQFLAVATIDDAIKNLHITPHIFITLHGNDIPLRKDDYKRAEKSLNVIRNDCTSQLKEKMPAEYRQLKKKGIVP